VESAVVGASLWVLDRMSPAAASRLAERLGDATFLLHRRRRKLAIANVLRAGVAADEAQATTIARASFRSFSLTVIETLKNKRESDAGSGVEWHLPPETEALLKAPGQGLILVSGHIGNFETAGRWLSRYKPVLGVARRMNNPGTDRLMQKRVPEGRFRITPKHDADRGRLMAALRQGEILAVLIDQFAREHPVMVDFFGEPAATYPSTALLHLITGAPLVFGYTVRTAPGRHKLVLSEPLRFPRTGNREADVKVVLDAVTRRLEDAIRACPGQYLWAHRRWRSVPPSRSDVTPVDAGATVKRPTVA